MPAKDVLTLAVVGRETQVLDAGTHLVFVVGFVAGFDEVFDDQGDDFVGAA